MPDKQNKLTDKQQAVQAAHEQWMAVTATAVVQLHCSDGYKGVANKPLIRPQPLLSEEHHETL